ncbi:putative universal stress protein A [Candidatus Nitrososphaera gargensis Ga9.2]|uniref:Putative universal stress protein A n=1 Tax=Nitrososphaera gargensis (strain Ga9.2) TaxID=1237085 RepID=K0IMI3_NITGG|nr:universal stress protein [Candidatus Nitrososphaera gargensis]AFU60312.1 putative universal stress protein A [Candidatus Nitrososphaera gargensis Ga9.2]
MVFKKILVPYDESAYSKRALEIAAQYADEVKNTQIIVLHVVPVLPVPAMYLGTARSTKTGETTTMAAFLKEVHQEMKIEMAKRLQDLVKKYRLQHPIATKIVTGSPAEKILEVAKEETVDLIVMGRAGATGIGRIVKAMGSVSRVVSEKSSCPVMLVNKN